MIVAFDFFTVPTVTFQLLYCFFVIEHGRRKIPHFNVTGHPTAEWVLQQLREAFPEAAPYRYVILDRDSKFDTEVIASLKATGLTPKRTSVQAPWQNGISERWVGSVRREILDHAKVIVACDFFVLVTASFRVLYVFAIMELGTRRILRHNVTAHPTAEWTVRQFREAMPGDHPYQFVIHDRDSIFSRELDQSVTAVRVRVLRTLVRAPKANSVCERFGATLRRECLDFVIRFNERQPKLILRSWMTHFNHGGPHMSLGPGIPAPVYPSPPESTDRHRIPAGHVIRSKPVLGGLHHEYSLEKVAA